MAILHRTYLFDSASFHSRLEKLIYNNHQIDLGKLQRLAYSFVQDSSKTTKKLLEDLRYDEEWFDSSDPEISHTTEWYMLVLASECKPTLSLTNQSSPVSWHVLQLLLPFVGWEEKDIEQLIQGRLLNELVASSNNKAFVNEFSVISHFGGWLRLQDTRRLFDKLEEVRETLPILASKNELTVDFAELWTKDPKELVQQAFDDAVSMLRVALTQNSDLFIILD